MGGAKKVFSLEKIELPIDKMTIEELLNQLLTYKPKDTPDFDIDNILIAVNGIDSNTLEGIKTNLTDGDIVSIIPIIHGGSKNQYEIGKTNVGIYEIKGNKHLNHEFLNDLRKKYPKLTIQGISSQYILNKSHVLKILAVSLEAKKNKSLLAEKLETDILLRLAGTSQISKAITKTGINSGKNFVIIVIGKKDSLTKIYSSIKPFVIKMPDSKCRQAFLKKEFGISKTHLECTKSKTPLEDLLAEQAAILF